LKAPSYLRCRCCCAGSPPTSLSQHPPSLGRHFRTTTSELPICATPELLRDCATLRLGRHARVRQIPSLDRAASACCATRAGPCHFMSLPTMLTVFGEPRFLDAKTAVDFACCLAAATATAEPGSVFVSSPVQFPLGAGLALQSGDLQPASNLGRDQGGARLRRPMAWGLKAIKPQPGRLNTKRPTREVVVMLCGHGL